MERDTNVGDAKCVSRRREGPTPMERTHERSRRAGQRYVLLRRTAVGGKMPAHSTCPAAGLGEVVYHVTCKGVRRNV